MTSVFSRGAIMLSTLALTAALTTEYTTAQDRVSEGTQQDVAGLKCDALCLEEKVTRHLILMWELGSDEALQASQRELIAFGPRTVRIAFDVYNHWSSVREPDPKLGARPGEMRWRAVEFLGNLGSPEAVPALYEIARATLPDPRADEHRFADEYRIRLRAIAGLEKLKAAAELRELHSRGGVLKNATATSLFVLGVNVGGVRMVEAVAALKEDKADSKDYHPSKARAPQPLKPGSQKFKVTPRPDTPKPGR